MKRQSAMANKNTVNKTISVMLVEYKVLKQTTLDDNISVSTLIKFWLEKYQTEKEAGK